MSSTTLFQALGGFDGVRRLAHAWHERVLADEIVAHAFSHGYHPEHTDRLAAYWSEAWGGPALYTALQGTETAVVRMHSGNGEHDEMDRRAIACFAQALDDAGVEPPALREALTAYFTWATQVRMAAYPHRRQDVPDGLTIARWDWHGLASSGVASQAPTIQPSSGSTPAGQP
jgi:hemoglobin